MVSFPLCNLKIPVGLDGGSKSNRIQFRTEITHLRFPAAIPHVTASADSLVWGPPLGSGFSSFYLLKKVCKRYNPCLEQRTREHRGLHCHCWYYVRSFPLYTYVFLVGTWLACVYSLPYADSKHIIQCIHNIRVLVLLLSLTISGKGVGQRGRSVDKALAMWG